MTQKDDVDVILEIAKADNLVHIIKFDGGMTTHCEFFGKDEGGGAHGEERIVLTIALNGKNIPTYYIFCPNPRSISPITFTYFREGDGNLCEVAQEERDEHIETASPNLWALWNGEPNDGKDVPIE